MVMHDNHIKRQPNKCDSGPLGCHKNSNCKSNNSVDSEAAFQDVSDFCKEFC